MQYAPFHSFCSIAQSKGKFLAISHAIHHPFTPLIKVLNPFSPSNLTKSLERRKKKEASTKTSGHWAHRPLPRKQGGRGLDRLSCLSTSSSSLSWRPLRRPAARKPCSRLPPLGCVVPGTLVKKGVGLRDMRTNLLINLP
jgi:hypothetical protein